MSFFINNFLYHFLNNSLFYYSLLINLIYGSDRCLRCNKLSFFSLCKTCILNITENFNYFKVDKVNFNYFSKLYFDEVYSVESYQNIVFLIKEYKFNNKLHLAPFLGNLLNLLILKNSISFDLIMNIPNHDFFQYTLYLALNLSKIHKKDVLNVISIRDKTQRQHFLENQKDRIKNAQNKYFINQDKVSKILLNICNKFKKDSLDILIVDDIIKTGSTINEISKILKKNLKLINKITVISLAKA